MSIGTLLTHQGSLLLYSVTVFRCVSGSPFKGRATYPNRENKLWCTANGIRLSGPRLGRKSVTEKASESKQIYQDSCERVAIEGEFGVVKRRYGLDRIMCRLPDTSMTSIAMGFFAANTKRLTMPLQRDRATAYNSGVFINAFSNIWLNGFSTKGTTGGFT